MRSSIDHCAEVAVVAVVVVDDNDDDDDENSKQKPWAEYGPLERLTQLTKSSLK